MNIVGSSATEDQIKQIPADTATVLEIGDCLPNLIAALDQAHVDVQDYARHSIADLLTVLADQRAVLAEAMVQALLLRWRVKGREGTYDITCRRLIRAFEHIVRLEELEGP